MRRNALCSAYFTVRLFQSTAPQCSRHRYSGVVLVSIAPSVQIFLAIDPEPFGIHPPSALNTIMPSLRSWPLFTAAAHCLIVAIHVGAITFNGESIYYSDAEPAVRIPLHVWFLLAHYTNQVRGEIRMQNLLSALFAGWVQSVTVAVGLHIKRPIQSLFTFGAGFHLLASVVRGPFLSARNRISLASSVGDVPRYFRAISLTVGCLLLALLAASTSNFSTLGWRRICMATL